jgi:hypothetical protein|tara:strand:+ start:698 stop:856 length:159 start_codon:yes stop_codon:yes gene_type:complete
MNVKQIIKETQDYDYRVEVNIDMAKDELKAHKITRMQYQMIMRDIEKGVLTY